MSEIEVVTKPKRKSIKELNSKELFDYIVLGIVLIFGSVLLFLIIRQLWRTLT